MASTTLPSASLSLPSRYHPSASLAFCPKTNSNSAPAARRRSGTLAPSSNCCAAALSAVRFGALPPSMPAARYTPAFPTTSCSISTIRRPTSARPASESVNSPKCER
eukprot:2909423-Rhodomonas_salina.1